MGKFPEVLIWTDNYKLLGKWMFLAASLLTSSYENK